MKDIRAASGFGVGVGDSDLVVGAGLDLLASVADNSGLTRALSEAIIPAGERAPEHDRGRALVQAAMMVAGGGTSLADMAALRDQDSVFGAVPSDSTLWRIFNNELGAHLDAITEAITSVRDKLWDGRPGGVTIDIDATLTDVHSENKQGTAPTYKRGYGFHPMLAFGDRDGIAEPLAALLRPGNAGSNTAVDQLAIVDAAIAALPVEYRSGHAPGGDPDDVKRSVTVRADGAGDVKDVLAGFEDRNLSWVVTGRYNPTVHEAVSQVKHRQWRPAHNRDGSKRKNSFVVEVTGQVDVDTLGYPKGMRVIVRREKLHPGAQMRLWDDSTWRHQIVYTNMAGRPTDIDMTHRQHARVENQVKWLKDCGADHHPFTSFTANQAWLQTCLIGMLFLSWFQQHGVRGELANAAPRTLRWRILQTPAQLVRHARSTTLRFPTTWPWSRDIADAHTRIAALC